MKLLGPAVISPTLLDVLAFRDKGSEGCVDQIGRVILSVGSVGTNVAVNLAEMGFRPQLVSYFGGDSLIGSIMRKRLASVGIDVHCPVIATKQPLPSFVGIFDGARLSAAVTSSVCIPEVAWPAITNSIEQAPIVICDTNMSKAELVRLAGICEKLSIPLAVVCASDAKAARLRWRRSSPLALVSLNIDEASALGVDMRSDPTVILANLGAEVALITEGAAGASYLDRRGRFHIPPPRVRDPFTTGAGDALFSAVCAQLVRRIDPISDAGLDTIQRTLQRVLMVPGSNLRAEELIIN